MYFNTRNGLEFLILSKFKEILGIDDSFFRQFSAPEEIFSLISDTNSGGQFKFPCFIRELQALKLIDFFIKFCCSFITFKLIIAFLI